MGRQGATGCKSGSSGKQAALCSTSVNTDAKGLEKGAEGAKGLEKGEQRKAARHVLNQNEEGNKRGQCMDNGVHQKAGIQKMDKENKARQAATSWTRWSMGRQPDTGW